MCSPWAWSRLMVRGGELFDVKRKVTGWFGDLKLSVVPVKQRSLAHLVWQRANQHENVVGFRKESLRGGEVRSVQFERSLLLPTAKADSVAAVFCPIGEFADDFGACDLEIRRVGPAF